MSILFFVSSNHFFFYGGTMSATYTIHQATNKTYKDAHVDQNGYKNHPVRYVLGFKDRTLH